MINVIIKEVNKENKVDLQNTIVSKIMCDENKEYYTNRYYMFLFNGNPVVAFINQKRIIHIILMEKSQQQSEFILKDGQLKYYDAIWATPKELINKAINNDLFFNQSKIENIEIK
jgi:spore coat protein CotF